MGRPDTPKSPSATPGRMRASATVLLLGCLIFKILYNAIGGAQSPGPAPDFPRKIWQSWKVDPLRFEARDAERAISWTTKNPRHRYECLTDDNAATYVEEHFGPRGFNRPDIVSIYNQLERHRIIQADLLRYLLLYAEGGVWADIDVEALRPVDEFVPAGHDASDVDLVIGIETDEPGFKDHPVLGSKSQSFCQWTFLAKPRHPVMLKLVNRILQWIGEVAAEQGTSIGNVRLDFDQVLSGTGPSAFTNVILSFMSERAKKEITWDTFHNLEESKVVASILVLTPGAFAAGTGHSHSGNHGARSALVKHHFHASSWTDAHPRFKHPLYGEVERCNWDPECVKLWDANTAFFAALPREEQMKLVAMR